MPANLAGKRLTEILSLMIYAVEATDLEEVLQRIAHVSRNIVEAKYAALGVPNRTGGLRYFKVSGMSDESVRNMPHPPRGEGLIGAIMHERKTIRLEDMHQDERSVGFGGSHHPYMKSLLGVPVQMGHQLFGMLYLCDRADDKPFDEEDQILIETMASCAALAIASAELRDRQSRLKLLEERERIGMELHDGVIQSLYALGMQLDLVRRNDQIQQNDLNPIIIGLDDVIGDIRHYILKLRSMDEQKRTMRACLIGMLDHLLVPDELVVVVDAPETVPPFPPATFEAICLIVNEAISNAVRHAGASQLHISAEITDKTMMIRIRDDGRGFEARGNYSGLGLQNMHRRARLYGGIVEIDTAPGSGTSLSINIPTTLF